MPPSQQYVILYHYTSVTGRKGIMKSGIIRRSEGSGDAVYGHGVYMTSKDPRTHSMDEIAENNFDGNIAYWKSKVEDGVTKYALQLKIPADQVNRVDKKRNVWLYSRDHLDFHKYHTGNVFEGSITDGDYMPWYMQDDGYLADVSSTALAMN